MRRPHRSAPFCLRTNRPIKILDGLNRYLDKSHIASVTELTGAVCTYGLIPIWKVVFAWKHFIHQVITPFPKSRKGPPAFCWCAAAKPESNREVQGSSDCGSPAMGKSSWSSEPCASRNIRIDAMYSSPLKRALG